MPHILSYFFTVNVPWSLLNFMVFSVIRHARPKYTFVSVFNVNIFISHKKDIIFAWPCKYSAINLGSLAYIGGYKLTYTRARHLVRLLFFTLLRNNFNFIQFSVFSSQWCPSVLYFQTYILIEWPTVYLIVRIPLVTENSNFISHLLRTLSWK